MSYFYSEIDLKRTTSDFSDINDKADLRKSPELQNISGYINTSQDDLKEKIEGNVGHLYMRCEEMYGKSLENSVKQREISGI